MRHLFISRSSATVAVILALGACADDSAGTGVDATGTTGSVTTGSVPTTGAAATTTMATTGGAAPAETSTGPVEPGTSGGEASTGGVATTGGCGADDPLCGVPPEEQVPQDKPDGLPSPLPGVYDDMGAAPEADGVRALIGFPTRDRAGLEQRVRDLYDPEHPDFGAYLTPAEWVADHAPPQEDFELVIAWLASRGMAVNFTASNRALIQFSGDVGAFNATFATVLHVCMRKNPQQGLPPFPVYCTVDSFTLPKFVAERTTGLLTADLPAAIGVLPNEGGAVIADPPGGSGLTPGRAAVAYEVDQLYDLGFDGQGQRIGVVAAAHYHEKDLQTFWKSFGVVRGLPTVVEVMEPVVTRITETILDVQWSSSLAPGADVTVYEGPDARNTSLLFVFNEAIARGEIDVLTDSFAHREDSEPQPVREQYDHSALMAAALGITVVSASGDSARPDTPCTSPYVTCVGGTKLEVDGAGNVLSEVAWSSSGSGENKSFAAPYWQTGVAPGDKRAVCDVALAASGYWVRLYGEWFTYGGTSFSSPTFAGTVAVINSYRADKGLTRVGFLNPAIYLDEAVQASFRDVTDGGTDLYDAGPGWDMPTGWGAPRAKKLADALP